MADDVERITTTERYSELANAIWREAQPWVGHAHADRIAKAVADAVLPFIAAERVRVVEGLIATIKALPALEKGTSIGTNYYADADFVRLDDVLAVVEAAREDTT